MTKRTIYILVAITIFLALIFPGLGGWGKADARNFPSVFMPWIPCGDDPSLTESGKWEWCIELERSQFPPGYPEEESDENINFMIRAAQYDLHMGHPYTGYVNGHPQGYERILGMAWDYPQYPILGTNFTQETIERGLKRRAYMKSLNPDLTLLMDLHWTYINEHELPADHPWWFRDANGNRIVAYTTPFFQEDSTVVNDNYYFMDMNNPDYVNHLVQRALNAVNSGVYDGVIVDCAIGFIWQRTAKGVNNDPTNLIIALRAAFGPDKIIMVNTSYNYVPEWTPYINGVFMEAVRGIGCDWGSIVGEGGGCFPSEVDRWQSLEDVASAWHNNIAHQPQIIALEVQSPNRGDLAEMRAATALSMTHATGYIMYAEPYYLDSHDHGHQWYSFWEEDLGVPITGRIDRADGAFQKEYSNGTVIYNPPGNATITVTFSDSRLQVSTGLEGYSFVVNGRDGDMFYKE